MNIEEFNQKHYLLKNNRGPTCQPVFTK